MSVPLTPGEQQVADHCSASLAGVRAVAAVRNAFSAELRDYDHGESEREAEEADRLDGLEQFEDDPGPEEEY